jgi:hypothetical protein
MRAVIVVAFAASALSLGGCSAIEPVAAPLAPSAPYVSSPPPPPMQPGTAAPGGYYYEAGSFTPIPKDTCQRTDVMQGIVRLLSQKIGKSNGPPAQVVSAYGLTGEWDRGVLNCRGILQTAAGPNGPGIVQVTGDITPTNYGNIAAFNVRDAKWETDADLARRMAEEKKARIAESEQIKNQADYYRYRIDQCLQNFRGQIQSRSGEFFEICARSVASPR